MLAAPAPGGKNRVSMKELGKGAVEQLKRLTFVQHRNRHAYIVVGGRTAAGYVVRALVDAGAKAGEVAVITDEDELPYEGPALNSALLKNACHLPPHYTCSGTALGAQDQQWYRDHGVAVYTNVSLLSHVPSESLVRSIDFVDFVYTAALVVATGTSVTPLPIPHPPSPSPSPRTPASDRVGGVIALRRPDANGVFYLDCVADVRRLLRDLEGAPKVCVVLGGTSSGVETASALCEMGHSVTLVCDGDYPMSSFLPVAAGELFTSLLESKGVQVLTDLRCVAFLDRNTRLRACKFHTGEVVDAEVAVVAVGRHPSLGPFADSLRTQKSGDFECVKVDSAFQTSVPGVFAIGDIAAMPFAQFASSQIQHASHGRASAQYVAQRILADDPSSLPAYNHLPCADSTLFGISFQVLGETSGDLTITQGSLEGKFVVVWLWERKVLGLLVCGLGEEEREMGRRLVSEQPVVDDVALRRCGDVDGVLEALRQFV